MRLVEWIGLGAVLAVAMQPGCTDDVESNDSPSGDALALGDAADGQGAAEATDAADGQDAADATDGVDGTDGGETVTWHGQVRAIAEKHCTSCHLPGGIGPFDMTSYEATKPWAAAVGNAVDSGRMPPFYADVDNCRTYEGQNVVSEDDKLAIAAWVSGGAPEGDPTDYVAPVTDVEPDLGPPDLALDPDGAYTPDGTIPDDFRCFPLGTPFEETVYASTIRVRPDYLPIVHHVIVFKVPASAVGQMKELDEDSPGAGYPCFGGPQVPGDNVGGWVPGGGMGLTIPDSATELEAGSQLVVQLHYNMVYATPAPDATGVDIWLAKKDPKWLLKVQGLPHVGLFVEAGNANSVEEKVFSNPLKDTTVVAVTAHMHLLATRIEVVAPGLPDAGEPDTCLLDIPRWDYHWQRSYVFDDFKPITLPAGQEIRLRCTYDNSAANQPYIDGVQGAPADVRWGEGTLDEMCLAYLVQLEPYAPSVVPTGDCAGFSSCYDTCLGGGLGFSRCVVQCAGEDTCRKCIVPAVLGCYSDAGCGAEVTSVQDCFKTCGLKASCYTEDCAEALGALDACAMPKAGSCGDACGTTLP